MKGYECIMSDISFVRSQHMHIIKLCKDNLILQHESTIYHPEGRRELNPEYYTQIAALYEYWKKSIKPVEVRECREVCEYERVYKQAVKDFGVNVL